MLNPAARAIRSLLRRCGVDLVRYGSRTPADDMAQIFGALTRLRALGRTESIDEAVRFLNFCGAHQKYSKAQLFQDLFVQFELNMKQGGFFVEFGATNGIDLSNTYLLEKEYGWSGILAEPGLIWREALQSNRNCRIDFRCVWDGDGESLSFKEPAVPELATVKNHAPRDLHAKSRERGRLYPVESVTLSTLLRDHSAPKEIDYLSLDTEGSELRILSASDFQDYEIKIITVEHNHTVDREKIHSLLHSRGYTRKFEMFSHWDDWYLYTG